MPAQMDYEFGFGGGAQGNRIETKPFNILVLGNFSGHAETLGDGSGQSLGQRRIVEVDIDNRETLWSIFQPHLELKMKSGSVSISPRDIDDFHPDELYRNLPVFADLRKLRKDLLNPDTAQQALSEVMSSQPATDSENETAASPPDQPAENADDMFERLLGKSSRPSEARQAASSLKHLDTFIQDLVAPHIVHEPDPRVDTAVSSVDMAIAELMRSILHHPDFQALEAQWRSLFDTVSELELDENLHLHVCDIRRHELLAGLPEPGTSLQESPLFDLLVKRRQAVDDEPWTVIVTSEYYGPGGEDIALLTALGAAAAVGRGILLGAATPAILGCSDITQLADVSNWSGDGDSSLWQSLRKSAVAGHIGLALPRLLCRLPYGEATEEIDSFEFEEMPQRNHEDYLWANPALACARLLGQSFTMRGWSMSASDTVDLGVLPAHNYTEDGESRLQPCAEILLPESMMVALQNQGLMPLVSYRNQNTAVVGRFQSIADPVAALAGPWSG